MRYFRIVFLLFICSNSVAQLNLVPNPSFEDTLNCDSFPFYFASQPWFTPTNCTPDYYYATNPTCGFSSFLNQAGFQLPHSGIAYVGLFASDGANTREYISVSFQSSLVNGIEYYLEFYVSRANTCYFATDDLGAYLSSVSPFQSGCAYIFENPQISNLQGNILSDSSNWLKISGTFIANGGENYLTIGNFKDSTNTTLVDADNGLGEYGSSYYYIDDVLLAPSDSIVSVIENPIEINDIKVYPSLIEKCEPIYILSNNNFKASLFSNDGSLIENFNLKNGIQIIETCNLKAGLFILVTYLKNQIKILKIMVT